MGIILDRLKRIAKRKRVTQKVLGKGAGILANHVSQIFAGKKPLYDHYIEGMCDAMQIPVADLFAEIQRGPATLEEVYRDNPALLETHQTVDRLAEKGLHGAVDDALLKLEVEQIVGERRAASKKPTGTGGE